MGLWRRVVKVKIAHVNILQTIGMRLIGRVKIEIQWSDPFDELSVEEIGVIVLRFLQRDGRVDEAGGCRLKGCATIEDLIKIAADIYFGCKLPPNCRRAKPEISESTDRIENEGR